jgi:hypothetical protein
MMRIKEVQNMARKQENWITVKRAAEILTANSGHTVSETYVRRLGKLALIETLQVDGRTKLYSESDIKAYRVKPRGDGSVRRAQRSPKPKGEVRGITI